MTHVFHVLASSFSVFFFSETSTDEHEQTVHVVLPTLHGLSRQISTVIHFTASSTQVWPAHPKCSDLEVTSIGGSHFLTP